MIDYEVINEFMKFLIRRVFLHPVNNDPLFEDVSQEDYNLWFESNKLVNYPQLKEDISGIWDICEFKGIRVVKVKNVSGWYWNEENENLPQKVKDVQLESTKNYGRDGPTFFDLVSQIFTVKTLKNDKWCEVLESCDFSVDGYELTVNVKFYHVY